jgi:hypothetical protein
MRDRQVIHLYQAQQVLKYIPRGKELKAHGRLAPVQRWLWRLLSRMNALVDHLEETTEYIRVLIKDEEVINLVGATLDGIYMRGGTPKEIFMGPNKFAELMNSPMVRDYAQPFSFNVSYEYGTPSGRTLMGLPVHVLPQMEGVLVR